MRYSRASILRAGLAGLGAFLSGPAVWAGSVPSDGGASEDLLSMCIAPEKPAPMSVPEPRSAATGRDDWMSFCEPAPKPVRQATQAPVKARTFSNPSAPAGATVPASASAPVFVPERALTRVPTRGTWTAPEASISNAAPAAAVEANTSTGGQSRQVRRMRTGGQGFTQVAGAGVQAGQFPAFQYPYEGYNNNPFTGLSSYSNGYAGAPPTSVPFAGGFFQGRSAFYSQPTLIVPVVTATPAYPIYPGYIDPYAGGYGYGSGPGGENWRRGERGGRWTDESSANNSRAGENARVSKEGRPDVSQTAKPPVTTSTNGRDAAGKQKGAAKPAQSDTTRTPAKPSAQDKACEAKPAPADAKTAKPVAKSEKEVSRGGTKVSTWRCVF